MKVGVITMILPRMELFHLADWLEHLAWHKIARVWVYAEPGLVRDTRSSPEFSADWKKKPFADQRLDLTCDQALQRSREICHSSKTQVLFQESMSTHKSIAGRQSENANHALKQMKDDGFDWAVFIDIDEYLVARPNLFEVLDACPSHATEIRMRQKVFSSRWAEGSGVSVCEIGENFGLMDFAHKYFFRPARIKRFGNIHTSKKLGHTVHKIEPSTLRFHHFRISRTNDPIDPRFVWDKKYENVKRRGLKENDYSHAIHRSL